MRSNTEKRLIKQLNNSNKELGRVTDDLFAYVRTQTEKLRTEFPPMRMASWAAHFITIGLLIFILFVSAPASSVDRLEKEIEALKADNAKTISNLNVVNRVIKTNG